MNEEKKKKQAQGRPGGRIRGKTTGPKKPGEGRDMIGAVLIIKRKSTFQPIKIHKENWFVSPPPLVLRSTQPLTQHLTQPSTHL
jgi:hypothetical protein